ncbi:MAG: hypothetical protein V3V40_03985 [Nitrosomonadaceae bacterium]
MTSAKRTQRKTSLKEIDLTLLTLDAKRIMLNTNHRSGMAKPSLVNTNKSGTRMNILTIVGAVVSPKIALEMFINICRYASIIKIAAIMYSSRFTVNGTLQ